MAEKLTVNCLRARRETDILSFTTTAEVSPLSGLIGQERAVQSLAFGLRMKDEGYNIFVMGLTGTGRNSYTTSIVSELAARLPAAGDWCYVCDFEHLDTPKALAFRPGEGHVFKEMVEALIMQLKKDIPRAFVSDEFKALKHETMQAVQGRSLALMGRLTELAKQHGLAFKPTGRGFVTIPLVDGKPMSDEVLETLGSQEVTEINERIGKFSNEAEPIMEEQRNFENDVREKLQTLEKSAALSIVVPLIDAVRGRFPSNEGAQNYLIALQKDVIKNIGQFVPRPEEENGEHELLTFLQEPGEAWDLKYRVNLFVDNRDLKGAPVIKESNATYYNLMGMIEFQHRMGGLTTDFTRIKAGAIHRANGGYLILQAEDLFGNHHSWRALKRALKDRNAKIENASDAGTVVSGLKPQGIPVNLKVIIIGSYEIHRLLYQYDEDFKKLFKVKVDFETEMERGLNPLNHMASFISRHCKERNLKHFHREAVEAVVDFSSRLADNQNKLSTRFNEIVELLSEASAWAEVDGSELVLEKHVVQTLEQKRFRSDKYEEKVHDLFEEGTLLVSTTGTAVGQINGLAVYDLGDYSFGKPSRITVNTFAGKSGVVNIEKEAGLSGSSHNKGVHILSGYLGWRFAQDYPLTLTATLCFEQSYDGVDGDSASSTELYALLSSLANVPIRQGLAVTGSVNQKGEIQPIGGVNQKIEGYYRVCKRLGLTGEQGVLIPRQNIPNLMLDVEVVEAVRNGLFNVYAVGTIDEGIELLTGRPAGVTESEGHYAEGSVYALVAAKLHKYYLQSLKK